MLPYIVVDAVAFLQARMIFPDGAPFGITTIQGLVCVGNLIAWALSRDPMKPSKALGIVIGTFIGVIVALNFTLASLVYKVTYNSGVMGLLGLLAASLVLRVHDAIQTW